MQLPRDLSRPVEEVVFVVPPEDAGQRLDAWIALRVSWRSRSDLVRRIEDGRILLDGQPVRKSQRLDVGQCVKVIVDSGPALDAVPEDQIKLEILYEDEDLVALDKAPGAVVHPVGRRVNDTLLNVLALHYKKRGLAIIPRVVHRLDQDTSGVLVFAKSEAARRLLGADFEERRVQKEYLALVQGSFALDKVRVDQSIGSDEASEIKLKMACTEKGRSAQTDFELLAKSDFCSLVRCRPLTGRQHQIRVHLQFLGHPILCDALYGNPGPIRVQDLDPRSNDPEHILLARQALHAAKLSFRHPKTGSEMTLESPLPRDFLALCP